MKALYSRILITVAVLVAVIAAAAVGYWFAGHDGMSDNAGEPMAADNSEPEVLYWVAPMDENFRRDAPGKSPMGMDLVPVYADGDQADDEGTVRINAAITQNLGVRTTEVMRGPMARELHAVGYTAWDPSRVTMLHPRAEGWLEAFPVASVGDAVSRGQVLYELFAPKLVSAQQEYLSALQSGNEPLIRAAGLRLESLGLTRAQVDTVRKRGEVLQRLSRRAERDGVVAEINAREGSYVMPDTTILTLADLSTVWVDVDVFQDQASWLRSGLTATAEFPAFPGEQWQGQVSYVYPELDSRTRSVRLRLEFDNPDQRLKPNMFANVQVAAEPREAVLQVPREAVIRSGQGERVVVALGDGRFRVQPVSLGLISGDMAEITAGLEAGDEVVVSGQFLLDAEANGEQAFARLNSEGGDMDDSSMDMDMESMSQEAMEPEALMPSMAGESSAMDETDAESTIPARAVVTQGPEEGRLKLRHEPIPELGWPAMNMMFEVADEVDVSHIETGQTVRIELREDQGSYRVVALQREEPES